MRGLTTHSRRDPRNAKETGRTVRDLFCTGALEVGTKCLVWRLAGYRSLGLGSVEFFRALPSAAPQTQKPHTSGHDSRRLTTHCTISCAVTRYTVARWRNRTSCFIHSFIHFISFHFISFHFISFHFISFHFISFHFISFHFISFHFISFHFISFHFISFHFISFHFISFHFISFHFISFHFISFHFISFHFISFHFIHSFIHSVSSARIVA